MARIVLFDDNSIYWSEKPGHNLEFVLRVEKIANIVLEKNGKLKANDICTMLGVPKCFPDYLEYRKGNEYVNFHVFANDPAKMRFVNGWENSIWLDIHAKAYEP